jgi:DNA-binding transcriptional LysR family regulator
LAGLALAGSRTSNRMKIWFESMIGALPAIGFVSPDYELVGEVLAGSDMFAVVPATMARWMCDHHALAVLDVAMPPYVHTVYAIEREGDDRHDHGPMVRDLLLAKLARDETTPHYAQVST